MRKKLGLLVLVTFMLTAGAACSQPAADADTTTDINSTEDTASATDTNSVAGKSSAGKEETKNVSGETQEIEVKKIEYGTKVVVLEGKKLDQLTVTGTDNPYYCNLEENIKMEFGTDETPVLVCKDPVYDITYYVNYGRDNYIYAYRNGTSELAVEIPARDLFCKEGELYFIAQTDGQYQFSGFAQGNILKYNPKDGTVSVVVDCSAGKMIVHPQEICYRQFGAWQGNSRKEEAFIFSFVTGESGSWPMGVSGLRQWNGNRIKLAEKVREYDSAEYEKLIQDPGIQELLAQGYTLSGMGTGVIDTITLVDAQGNEKETLQNAAGITRDHLIIGNSIYYVEQRKGEEETEIRSVLRRYNKQTDTHEDIAVLGYITRLSTTDMIIHKNVVYFSNGLRVELDTGAQCLMQKAGGVSPQIKYFYTDGEKMFCVSEGKLWLFEEQPGFTIAVRESTAGVPLEIGNYVYRLCEP